MKIAVCIFGQPRFFKEAAESFRKEFLDMPNHEVDVFIHCWDEVGYTPDDDIKETNEKPDAQRLKDDIWNNYGGKTGNIKSIEIESPEKKFYEIADSLGKVIETIRDERLYEDADWRKYMGKLKLKGMNKKFTDCAVVRIAGGKVLRYEMGQFYSISNVIQQKAFYEKENDFKYDLVVRVRTDSFYIPFELYGNNEDEYYKDKEKYYSLLHTYYDGIGLMGHGLKLICGIGNGSLLPGKERKDTGYFTDLEHVEFNNGRLINLVNAPYEKGPAILENILDQNGMFSFPWKIHLKDWILMADSDTANRAWGASLSTYMAFAINDLIRFLGRKQVGFMPGGEVLNGLCGLLGNAKMCAVPDYTKEPNIDGLKVNRWSGLDLERNKKRTLKIVHTNIEKRKDNFIGKRGEGNLHVPHGGEAMPHGTHKEMVRRLILYARSNLDKENIICKIFCNNKKNENRSIHSN
tara:strand:- start:2196 stop:3584 length:1389 start_codon:yes stop_codon:yes gene_type:complete